MQKVSVKIKCYIWDICFEVLKGHKGLSTLKYLIELILWHLASVYKFKLYMGILCAFKVKMLHSGHFLDTTYKMVLVKHNSTYNSKAMNFRELLHHTYHEGSVWLI